MEGSKGPEFVFQLNFAEKAHWRNVRWRRSTTSKFTSLVCPRATLGCLPSSQTNFLHLFSLGTVLFREVCATDLSSAWSPYSDCG